MIVTVFQDPEAQKMFVVSPEGEIIHHGPEAGQGGETVDIPNGPEGRSCQMCTVGDIDDEFAIVQTHVFNHGGISVEVYSPDPSVVFVRIGDAVIAVHARDVVEKVVEHMEQRP